VCSDVTAAIVGAALGARDIQIWKDVSGLMTADPALFSATNNEIDRHVFGMLASMKIPPSAGASDAEFLRRASIDATGTLPTAAEARAFLGEASPDKRARLVDDLLARPEFTDLWALLLGDLLQNRKERDHDVRGAKGVRAFHQWLRDQVALNRRVVVHALGDHGLLAARDRILRGDGR
jgi:hypothetical protein